MSALPDLTGVELEAAVRLFEMEGDLVGINSLHRGHIHDTLVSTWNPGGGAGPARRFVHQRLNDRVFRDIPALMHNVGVVTRHLARAGSGDGTVDPLWRARLGPFFDEAKSDPAASLRLTVDESTRSIALVRTKNDDDE